MSDDPKTADLNVRWVMVACAMDMERGDALRYRIESMRLSYGKAKSRKLADAEDA